MDDLYTANLLAKTLIDSSANHGRDTSLRVAWARSRTIAFKLGARGLPLGVVFINRADCVSLPAEPTHTTSKMLENRAKNVGLPAPKSEISWAVLVVM
eukprot:10182302-Lingulodinium_polyedra.AAC.1